ncbi:MAG TPA: hypothetical protein VHG72_19685 [Polyangia bacterium]|nr:hypothetical protein [Polyangia bacterium]
MFKSRRNTISSDEGFTVTVLSGRGGVRYTEGDRSVEINSEFSGGLRRVILYTASIVEWESSIGRVAVNEEERDRIIENVCRAFKFDGYASEVL